MEMIVEDGYKFVEMMSLLPHMQFNIFLKENAKNKCECGSYRDCCMVIVMLFIFAMKILIGHGSYLSVFLGCQRCKVGEDYPRRLQRCG